MDRSKSKMINYGIVYGLSDYGLADRLNIPREEAKAFIDAYLERFPRVAAFMARRSSRRRSRATSRRCSAAAARSPSCGRATTRCARSGERLAVNTVIQGTAADVMKLAMIGVHRALARAGLQTRMILTIHDELLFEGPPEEVDAVRALVEREMVAPWGDRTPPLAVDVGVGRDVAGRQVAARRPDAARLGAVARSATAPGCGSRAARAPRRATYGGPRSRERTVSGHHGSSDAAGAAGAPTNSGGAIPR